MTKTPHQIVEELQSLADNERAQPIEIQLPDPGPYILPKCTKVLTAQEVSQTEYELELETELRQRVRLRIDASSLPALKALVDLLHSKLL